MRRMILIFSFCAGLTGCQTQAPVDSGRMEHHLQPGRLPTAVEDLTPFFDQVEQDAKKFGLKGQDVTACIDPKGKLVLGGVSNFDTPFHIVWYGFERDQAFKARILTRGRDDRDYRFIVGVNEMVLRLPRPALRGPAVLINASGSRNPLVCGTRLVGLD